MLGKVGVYSLLLLTIKSPTSHLRIIGKDREIIQADILSFSNNLTW